MRIRRPALSTEFTSPMGILSIELVGCFIVLCEYSFDCLSVGLLNYNFCTSITYDLPVTILLFCSSYL